MNASRSTSSVGSRMVIATISANALLISSGFAGSHPRACSSALKALIAALMPSSMWQASASNRSKRSFAAA